MQREMPHERNRRAWGTLAYRSPLHPGLPRKSFHICRVFMIAILEIQEEAFRGQLAYREDLLGAAQVD